jgi:hypothetical protein
MNKYDNPMNKYDNWPKELQENHVSCQMKDAQYLLYRAVNKSTELMFHEQSYRNGTTELVGEVVSKLHEAQSLLVKARMRLRETPDET